MPFKPWRWRLVVAGLVGLVVLSVCLLIADVMGVSKSVINGFFLVASIIGYATIGMFCRTTMADEYYVAGRRVSAPFNGMATAADWMSAASFLGVTGLLLSDGFVGDGVHAGGLAYVLGWTGGFCLLGFLFAAKLNASGATTIPQFLGQRFDSPVVRWLAALGAILCSSIYLVAQIYGVGLVASMLSGLTFELGVFLALGGILLCSFLGGMRAVTWTQVVQCVVIVASMVAVSVAVSWQTQGHPVIAVAAAQSLQQMESRIKVIEADPAEMATREVMAQRMWDLDAKMADPLNARELEHQVLAKQIAKAKSDNAPLRDIQRLETNPAWRETGVDRLLRAWQSERDSLAQTARGVSSASTGGVHTGVAQFDGVGLLFDDRHGCIAAHFGALLHRCQSCAGSAIDRLGLGVHRDCVFVRFIVGGLAQVVRVERVGGRSFEPIARMGRPLEVAQVGLAEHHRLQQRRGGAVRRYSVD